MKRLSASNFLLPSRSIPILDVRSPSEYALGHIPSSISFPLFSDDERAIIGTLYKHKGNQIATKKGMEIIGPKIKGIVTKANALGNKKLRIYCWRGGMRSESVTWLLERYGFDVEVLHGGYKEYRKELHKFFEQKLTLRVLTGYTGSKKTTLLHKLRDLGEQVVDLEGVAQHQGSSFGNQKSTFQPTTEHFQNLTFQAFLDFDTSQPIWIEDECRRIGKVTQIEALYDQIIKSPLTVLEVPKHERVIFLVKDYGHLSSDQLIEATQGIRKKLGYDNARKAIDYIKQGKLTEAVEIILHYYDKAYHRSLSRKSHLIQSRYKVSMRALNTLAEQLAKSNQHAV